MSLKESIAADMKTAMREKDSQRLDAIRLLRAAIQRVEVDDQTELDDTAVLGVVEKMIKQGRDSISQFEKGGRDDLVVGEQNTIDVLETYLPEQLSDDEISAQVEAAIKDTGAQSVKDMGKVMGKLKGALAGKADMGKVSAAVKAKLG